MRKKILRTLILVMLCMFACGVTASAASAVATIGSKNYSSIDKALKAVKNGQTIKLKKNLTLKKGKHIIIKRNVKFTLDLNKHTIKTLDHGATDDSSKVEGVIWVKKGNLTVKNGKVPNGCIKVEKGAKLTVNGGTYWQISNLGTTIVRKGTITTNKYSAIVNEGKLTVQGGTIKGKGNGIYQNISKASIVISGGTFKDFKDSNPLVWVGKGKVTISGGKFYATSSNGVFLNDSTATIKGGTFNSTASGMPLIYADGKKGKLTISGGTFKTGDENALYLGNGKATVTGGSYKGNGNTRYPAVYVNGGKLIFNSTDSNMMTGYFGWIYNQKGEVAYNGQESSTMTGMY